MIKLSVEDINETAPYKVTEGSQGFVDFITDHGVAYSVGFVFADILQSADTFQFYITNPRVYTMTRLTQCLDA